MSITLGRPAAIAGTVAATIGLGWAIGSATVGAQTSTEKSKKTAMAGGTTEVVGPGEKVLLLSEKIRTTKYTDLLLGVTAECAITTELTTVGNDEAGASGLVNVYIEIDGKRIAVTDTDRNFATAEDDGKITFCNRAEERETTLFDDEDSTIRTFQATKQANGFNWAALNVGPANVVHEIKVYGELVTATDGSPDTSATAAIGRRTLIVEPVKAAKDEQVIDLDTSGT